MILFGIVIDVRRLFSKADQFIYCTLFGMITDVSSLFWNAHHPIVVIPLHITIEVSCLLKNPSILYTGIPLIVEGIITSFGPSFRYSIMRFSG